MPGGVETPSSRTAAVYTVAREDNFDFGSPEYTELHARAGAPPFQHGVWLTELHERLTPRHRARTVVVTVRDTAGHLAVVLPLVRRRWGPLRVLEYPNLGVSDFAAPVIDPLQTTAVLGDGAVVRRIRAVLGAFDLLRIAHVPDSPEIFLSMLPGARATRHAYRAHMLDLPATVQAWHETLDPAFNRHLKRGYKRLRPKGEHRLRLVDDPAEVERVMGRMRQFRAARFSERPGVDLTQDADYFAFYCAVARRSVLEGPARLVALEVAGEPAAVMFGLANSSTELYVLVGYDLERFRSASLGLLIVAEQVQAAIGRGLRQLDLTVGDEPYKSDFKARSRPLYEVRVSRTPLGAAGALAHDHYLGARRLAKRILTARRGRTGRARRKPG